MNPNDIDINKVGYKKTQITYERTKKLIIQTPNIITTSGLVESYGKWQIQFNLNLTYQPHADLYLVIRDIEEKNEQQLNRGGLGSRYKSCLKREGDTAVLTVKVPYRFGKYEFDIESNTIYLAGIKDIQPGTQMSVDILFKNLWSFTTDGGQPQEGCIIFLQKVRL